MDRSACHCAVVARYSRPPLRVAALRRSSRETVDADRPICRAISRTPSPCARKIASSSRSPSDRYRPESGLADKPNIAGGMPPAFRNHRVPTACGTPGPTAASSLDRPAAITAQNRSRSSRPATGGRPGDNSGNRPHRSERRFCMLITTPSLKVLRRLIECRGPSGEPGRRRSPRGWPMPSRARPRPGSPSGARPSPSRRPCG